MPSFLDMTAANALLKEYYDDQKVQNLVYKDNPLLAMLPKDEEAVGEYIPQPCIFEVSQGAGSAFATAQANQVAAQSVKFLITLKPGYSIGTVQNQVIEASATSPGAFLKAARVNIESAMRREKNRLAAFCFRSGTGSIGQVNASGWTSGVATLTNIGDIVHFGVGQTLQENATDGGATPRAALGYVIAVNRATGSLTVSASSGGAAGTPSGWTASEYLLTQSDNNATLSGLLAWLPATDPSGSDNFYGVNRSVDTTRLGGVRYNGTAQTIEEALTDGAALAAREGGMPEHGIIPYASWGSLEKALGAKVNYTTHNGPAEIAFRGIRLNGANTTIDVFPDRSCPAATAFLLQMDTWKLYSLGPAPKTLNSPDGLEMLRVYNADAAEYRCGEYANMGNEAPGWNANISISQ